MGRSKHGRRQGFSSENLANVNFNLTTANEESEEEPAVPKSPRSPRSIIKNSSKFGGDENSKSKKNKASSSSNDPESDAATKQKSWFWKRKKSGDKKKTDSEEDEDDKDKDAMSTAQQTIQTKTTQANKHTLTIDDCETEFHLAIQDHEWDELEGLLKEYDPLLYKKSKSKSKKKAKDGKPKKNMKMLKYMPDMPKIGKEKEEQEIPVSPLLALDRGGLTPLHLCCIEPTPSKLLLRLLNCERNAAAVKDKRGNLPLHLAIQHRRKYNVIERLVRSYYQGSWTGDGQNRSPLILAIDVVLEKQEEEKLKPTKTYWGFPTSPEDIKWQEKQTKLWEITGFLVQNRIDRRKRLMSIEHNQILMALNKCAPPDTMENILKMGKKALMTEEVAEKVLFLLISRQYPISLFNWFLKEVTVAFIKSQHDFTGCGVVAAHFRVGCIRQMDQKTKRERDSFAIIMKRHAFAKKNGKEFVLPPQFTEWWEKLKLFINLWATHFWEDGEEPSGDDEILLHNALMNSDSPPLLIQLLAKLYPESITLMHPKSPALPIHIACRQWQFQDFPPRKGEKTVGLDRICAEFLKEDATQLRKRSRNRLPLHHAIVTGKTWDFIKPIVAHDKESTMIRDPNTSLRPFQLAALRIHDTFDIEEVARREYLPLEWNAMESDEQDRQMRKLLYHQDAQRLDLIFELLRHTPDAVVRILTAEEVLMEKLKKENERLARENLVIITQTKLSRCLFRLGNVEGHFIGWCYEGDNKGIWKPHRRNLPMVKEAIMDGFVPRGMDKWWTKLKFWLWQDCPWDNIPRRADYLLHCALCNSKVSPWIVELILECFPRSATLPIPRSGGCYPLHIACTTDTYIPMAFEFANKRHVIEMVSKAFTDAVLLKWRGLLPLHHAIKKSKPWSEIQLMAEDEPVTVASPDSEQDFFAFQLMALNRLYTKPEIQRFVNVAMTKVGKHLWEGISADERVEQLEEVMLSHETDILGCTFELLKCNPNLVLVGTIESKNRRRLSDGSESTNKDKISIPDYLKMLKSNTFPKNDNPPQVFDEESDEESDESITLFPSNDNDSDSDSDEESEESITLFPPSNDNDSDEESITLF